VYLSVKGGARRKTEEALNTDILKNILEQKKQAAKMAEAIIQCDSPSKAVIYRHLRLYLLHKFLLEQDPQTDNIDELAEMSLAQMLKIDRQMINDVNIARGCDGASSVLAKKALFYMALQRELAIHLDPAQLAAAETVEELAELVYRALRGDER